MEDLLGVIAGGSRRPLMGGRGRTGSRSQGIGGAGSVRDFMVPGQQGITSTHAGGINYSDQWGDKFEATASYFFNMSDNLSEQQVYREYLLAADSGQIYNESSSSDSRNINHRFSGKIEYTINENNSILFRPTLSFQKNKGNSDFEGETILGNAQLNNIDNSSRSQLKALSIGNFLLFRHKFNKRGRTFSINLGNNLAQNKGDKYLLNTTRYFTLVQEYDLLNQNSLLITDSWSVNSSMVYTEPAGENGLLQFSYWLGYQDNESDQETRNFDQETNSYILLDTLLSNTSDNNYLTQRIGPSWQYRKGLFTFNAGLNYQYASLQNAQFFPGEFELKNRYNNILLNGMVRMGKMRTKSLSLRYNSSTDNPSISELQDVIDNSDPLQLKSGNPKINQSFIHRLFLRYSSMKPESSRVFFVMLSSEFRQDYIGNQTIFAKEDIFLENGYLLKKGTQLTRPVNLDGYVNFRSFITLGVPIKPLKLNINFNISGIYSRRPGLIDNSVNYSDTWMGGLGIMLSSNINENLDFSLFSQSGYNLATNSMNSQQNTNYFNQSTRFNFKWVLLKNHVIETTAMHQYFNGLSSSLDQNYLILNAAIGEKLFKNKLGEIKISVYDLLNQNQNLQREVSDIYIEDTETLSLQRLFMITFVYNIRNFNGEIPVMPAWGPGRSRWMRE
jgi:hypothetical protein